MEKLVFARSPTNAVELMEEAYKGNIWIEEPIMSGHALNVYQPADWEGIVDIDYSKPEFSRGPSQGPDPKENSCPSEKGESLESP
jgi:hypothetical protein